VTGNSGLNLPIGRQTDDHVVFFLFDRLSSEASDIVAFLVFRNKKREHNCNPFCIAPTTALANTYRTNERTNKQSTEQHAQGGEGVRQGHCQSHEGEGTAKTEILLPNVPKAVPGRQRLQVSHPIGIPFAADESLWG
jgi:hypothetical protein